MVKTGMQFTDKIKQQEEFVKAIGYQREAATHGYYEAKNYKEYIDDRYQTELNHLNKMKEQQ